MPSTCRSTRPGHTSQGGPRRARPTSQSCGNREENLKTESCGPEEQGHCARSCRSLTTQGLLVGGMPFPDLQKEFLWSSYGPEKADSLSGFRNHLLSLMPPSQVPVLLALAAHVSHMCSTCQSYKLTFISVNICQCLSSLWIIIPMTAAGRGWL